MSTDLTQAREALAAHLRRLHREAGLTGRALAARVGWSSSKVSRLATGRQTPTVTEIRAWCQACEAPGAVDVLLEELAALESFYRTWRRQVRAGLRFSQDRWLGLEAQVRVLRVFEPHFVPGLLQTEDYARIRLEEFGRLHRVGWDLDQAVEARMRRQAVLHRPTKAFHFLIGEGALRSGAAADRQTMAAQIDRLMVATTHTTVQLGVIPFGARWPFHVDHGFWQFDDQFVLVETITAELCLTQPEELATYTTVFEHLAAIAVYGHPLRALLAQILDDL